MASKLQLRLTLTLILLLLGHTPGGAATSSRAVDSPSNEALARAYKSAIDSFINDLNSRNDEMPEERKQFAASLASYFAEVKLQDDGFCVVFSPKEFNGNPVLGGIVSYCFDESGGILRSTSYER
jgi:hypothetical protein